ncbi:MAG: hydroxymethylbilane synthase, partial [Pseudomonadota bacterium]
LVSQKTLCTLCAPCFKKDYMNKAIKIGTRGSPLALVQAHMVRDKLLATDPDLSFEIVKIKTSGDWKSSDGETRLSSSEGGKGLFAKEIEKALLDGDIDAGVHSMKDMDSTLPDGLVIDCMLEREDARDALLIGRRAGQHKNNIADYSQLKSNVFDALPQGTVVGTASVRRGAFLLSVRPDLKIVPTRGNVQTRIDKIRGAHPSLENFQDHEKPSCTILAMAGLNRLGISDAVDVILEPEVMLPAAGQGAVGVQVRSNDSNMIAAFSRISCETTVACVKSEREILRILDGSCHTPIGAYAIIENDELWVRAKVASLDGHQVFEDETRVKLNSSQNIIDLGIETGRTLGERLKAQIPQALLEQKL